MEQPAAAAPNGLSPATRAQLGVITHGSLNGGVEMKLDAVESVEDVEAGTFMVVQGEQYDFFSMVTDVEIAAANERILLHPPAAQDDLLRRVLRGIGTYATVALKPMLMMPTADDPEFAEARSVKTVPAHFSTVARATEDDVARVFGSEHNDDKYFEVGQPLGMDDLPVCIDLKKFAERSNAVFGKTGTGKTFITRVLLGGLISSGQAVNIVFDMHSEYAFGDTNEEGVHVWGLKKLFPSKIVLYSLDPKGTRQRTGTSPDFPVHLYADQIEPRDILPLRDTLNLNDTADECCYLLQRQFGKDWMLRLLQADGETGVRALAETCGANESALYALYRRLISFERYAFFKAEASAGKRDLTEELLESLDGGKSVIFEFGGASDLKVYLLVANVITRLVRAAYEEKTNRYRRTKNQADKPKPLMITIEEAHKLLTSSIARETSFGKIAREMRKYFVSLLVVDQRPSAIDDEVLSQIGTKLVAQLSDDKDISAALVGTSDAAALRQVLASLDAKQQALVLGHAVPMPIVVKTRTYDEAFYAAMKKRTNGASGQSFETLQQQAGELF